MYVYMILPNSLYSSFKLPLQNIYSNLVLLEYHSQQSAITLLLIQHCNLKALLTKHVQHRGQREANPRSYIGGSLLGQVLVKFAAPIDLENPQNWPTTRKWAVTSVLSATGFNRIMVSTIMAPALSTIGSELHMSNIESVMALSVYLLATAFGPLLIGPLSEVYGRKPVLHATNIWFLIWNIVCGFAHSKGVLISARFLAGLGASAIYALAGGVLGDVWPPEQRGTSLGLYILIPLLGAAAGPIIGGFITQTTTWRWIF